MNGIGGLQFVLIAFTFLPLCRLQERMKQRQQEKAEQEKKEAVEREKLRRKQGRELTEAKQK